MVIILFPDLCMPAGVRIACNGSVHVTSKCLSRRRLRPGQGALKQLTKFIRLSQIYPRFAQGAFGFRCCDTGWTVMSEVCSICGGSGLRVVQENGRQFAQDCVCRVERRAERMLRRAHIPKRYEHCTLENYETNFPSSHRTLGAAHLRARKFVEGYPLETAGTGLLLTGSIGVGKTHLAVGILQALVAERGASGLFYDYRDLLKQIQNSYNAQVRETELEILAPVFEAEVLVLDELGASKPTDWVWDTVAHILNTRYNDRRTTIITTNYSDLRRNDKDGEILEDRIGVPLRSRLYEMCKTVVIEGEDYRKRSLAQTV